MKKPQYIWLVVAVVVVVIAGWFAFRSVATPPAVVPSGSAATSTTSTVSVTTTTSPSAPVVTATTQKSPTAPKQPVVTTPMPSASHPTIVSAPASNAQLVMGQSNTIQWNKAANITGSIYLVNAQSGAIVGWILQQTGPQQTSYSWNTQDLLVSRTSPTGITVAVGTYVVKVAFDSPEDPTITSAPFSIIAPNQVEIPTYSVTISNGTFSPSSLTVKRGDRIIFMNHDAVAYQILVSSFSPFSIAAGATYTFDTTPISPGPYSFYTNAYPSLRMSVTVQ